MQSGGAVASNPHTVTPNIMSLNGGGIALTSYHTYKVCSPSRASIMTGRYPWGVGYYRVGSGPKGTLSKQKSKKLRQCHTFKF